MSRILHGKNIKSFKAESLKVSHLSFWRAITISLWFFIRLAFISCPIVTESEISFFFRLSPFLPTVQKTGLTSADTSQSYSPHFIEKEVICFPLKVNLCYKISSVLFHFSCCFSFCTYCFTIFIFTKVQFSLSCLFLSFYFK